MKRALSVFMFVLLLVSMLTFSFTIQDVKASGTIYIRADGSIDPPTAPISTSDNVTYTLTGNITSDADGIVVERDNIVVDGAGFTVQGTEGDWLRGMDLSGRTNVTIKNMEIKAFDSGVFLLGGSSSNISGNNMTNNLFGVWLGYSENNTVFGNNITNNAYGVVLEFASNNSVSGNNITDNDGYGVWLDESSFDNNITENNITNNNLWGWAGIQISRASDNNISGNIIANNGDGIWLYLSSNNSIAGNNITNNANGVILAFTSNNTVSGNNITDNLVGIDLEESSSNSISGNNITDNESGLFLLQSPNNSIVGNVFLNDGLCVSGSLTCGNVVSGNLVNGKPLVYLEGVTGHVVNDAGQVVLVSCDEITVENLNLSNTDVGIQLARTNNSRLSGNSMAHNTYAGIYLMHSSNNTMIGNNVTTNERGGFGIAIRFSPYNSLSDNAMQGRWSFEVHGNSLGDYLQSVDTSNLLDGKPIYYFMNQSDIVVNDYAYPSVGYLGFVNCANVTVQGMNLTNNVKGLLLANTTSSKITDNNFIHNLYGIWLFSSPNNSIFHNYWSDYNGTDLYSGAYQNETGSDGIGDTPYVIDANNQDNYPLMNPWPSDWKLDFAGPTNHPIVDFAVYDGSLYAAADNKLYVEDGSSWNVVDAPTFVTSLEPYGDKLVVGGQGGLYCYNGTSFSLVFSMPTYIKVLGVYNSTLYAGTILDNPPKLYYCNGSVDNPSDWHIDTGFSDVLNFTGPFGSIDSFAVFDSNVDNPVGFWRFNEGSGATAYDSSGNGNDGTINGASWITGIAGSGLGFDGDDLVEIPDSSSLNPSEITVETWVSFDRLAYGGGYSSTDNQMLVCKGGWPIVGSYRLWQGGPNSSFQILFFDLGAGGPGTYVGSPELTLQTNRWYHIAGTYDGNTIKLYLDGVLQASRNIGSVPVGNTEPLYLGYHGETGWNYYLNGSLDEVAICNYAKTAEEILDDYVQGIGETYVASGGKVFRYSGTAWSLVETFDDVYACLEMEVHNGKLYLATRDQGWRKPLYQGGSGFSGRVIEFDGENWTTVLDHDYWIYSLGVYDNKLYAGTANKILTYNGTDWETSFNATGGAYYALCFENYDGKIYAGMGNGYIFADPAPAKAEHQTIIVPEFPSTTILAVFMALTMLATALIKKKRTRRSVRP